MTHETNIPRGATLNPDAAPVRIGTTSWDAATGTGFSPLGGTLAAGDPSPIYTIREPSIPKWEWCFGGDWHCIISVPTAPNWIHRFLLKWLLGVYYRRTS